MLFRSNREQAYEYAIRWAKGRNPLFYDFVDLGGDCTNYISQCILAGSCIMNYNRDHGWYYLNLNDRSPSWTGVRFLYDFLIFNRGVGPFGVEVNPSKVEIGDIIQLGDANGNYYHTLFVSGYKNNSFLVCAHTDDALDRPLRTYKYKKIRFIHIVGVRSELAQPLGCFEHLLEGTASTLEEIEVEE